jgi:hypothetical protein
MNNHSASKDPVHELGKTAGYKRCQIPLSVNRAKMFLIKIQSKWLNSNNNKIIKVFCDICVKWFYVTLITSANSDTT